MTRATATGLVGAFGAAVAVSAAAVPPGAARWLVAGTGLYVLVLAQARSMLPWTERLPAPRVARRMFRVLVYLLPAPFVGVPLGDAPAVALLAGIGVGAVGLAAQRRELRTSFSRRYLRLLPPIDPVERGRDLLFFGGSGAAQEYLYRGLLLAGLAPLGYGAVVVTAALFVAEHLLHFNAREEWDRKDVLLHTGLGLALGTVAWAWGSLPAAVAGHTVYNLPNVVQTVIRRGVPAASFATAEK